MNQSIALKDQPKVFAALKEGFTILSTHLYLMLFPLGLDLFFLFAPRFTIRTFAVQALDQFNSLTQLAGQSTDTIKQVLDSVRTYFEYFSLTSALRTYPVGVPSLLAGRPLAANPFGTLRVLDITDPGQIFLVVLGFSVVGLMIGSLYFIASRNATVTMTKKTTLGNILKNFGNLFLLSLIYIVVGFIISMPIMIIYGLFTAISPIIGIVIYFVAAMFLLSFIIPLYFAPHIVVLFERNPIEAIKMSLQAVRPYYSITSVFLTLELIFAFLTNLLWQTPVDNSAMLFVGIFGHALVTTALLIASFRFFENIVALFQEKFVNPQTA